MRVLLDNNVNQRFAQLLPGHEVKHAREMNWALLLNGDLIAAAERDGFDALVTADKSMQYQQTIATRRIAVIVLNALFLKWAYIEPLAEQTNEALQSLAPGSFIVIQPHS